LSTRSSLDLLANPDSKITAKVAFRLITPSDFLKQSVFAKGEDTMGLIGFKEVRQAGCRNSFVFAVG
jgi:hypothetical protein